MPLVENAKTMVVLKGSKENAKICPSFWDEEYRSEEALPQSQILI